MFSVYREISDNKGQRSLVKVVIDMNETTVTLTLPELAAGTEKAETAGRAQAEAEIADWLEGQAAKWEQLVGLSAAAKASALLAAAEAVRQGRARREGAALAAAGVVPGPEGGA